MSVSLKLDDQDKLLVSFPFSSEHIAQIKNIKGKVWRPAEKNWSIPFSLENLQLLEHIFTNEIILYDFRLNSIISANKNKEDKKHHSIINVIENREDKVQEGNELSDILKAQQEFDRSNMFNEL